jgi:hypothetical protein
MQEQQFEVHIRSNSSAPEDWKRAMEAPEAALHPLTEEQKEVARRFAITETEFARGELAGIYGRERLQARGGKLGETAQRLLAEFSPTARVRAVVYEGAKLRWLVRVETPDGHRNIGLAWELVDDVLDSELYESIQQLRQKLETGLK